ncbi:hypothetical protein EMIT0111MI5_10368 [Burkholderia sp. IT-111MI5]
MVSRRLRCGIDSITAQRGAKENGKGQTALNHEDTFRGARGRLPRRPHGAGERARSAGSRVMPWIPHF